MLESSGTAVPLYWNIWSPMCDLFDYLTKYFHFSFKVSEKTFATFTVWHLRNTITTFSFFLCEKRSKTKNWLVHHSLNILSSWVKVFWILLFWPVFSFNSKGREYFLVIFELNMKRRKKLPVIFDYFFYVWGYLRCYILMYNKIGIENTKSFVKQEENIFLKKHGFFSCSLKYAPILKGLPQIFLS